MQRKIKPSYFSTLALSLSACLMAGAGAYAQELPIGARDSRPQETTLMGLAARAKANELNQKKVEALNDFQAMLAADPSNNEGLQGTVRMLRKLGDPSLALRYMKLRPDLYNKQDVLDVGLEEAATFVRMGEHDAVTSANAFKMTDKALAKYAELAQEFGRSSPLALPAPGNFDYLIALYNRHREAEVIEGYESLEKSIKQIPDYAKMIAAASYSRKGNSERALAILETLFERKKNDIDYLRSLFYALTDTEQFDRAEKVIKDAIARTPEYIGTTQKSNRKKNPMLMQLIELSAINKAFNNQLAKAESEFNEAVTQSPDNKAYHGGLGTVALWGGYPRQAQREFNIAYDTEIESPAYALYSSSVKFLRGNDKEGRRLLETATNAMPFDGQAQRLKIDLDIRQAPYLYSEFNSRKASLNQYVSSTEQNLTVQVGGQVWSDTWRPYASVTKGRYQSMNNSGEYQPQFWTVGAQLKFEDMEGTVSIGEDSAHKKGLSMSGKWQMVDKVVLSGEISTATSDLSSRATENNLSASKKSMSVEWRPSYDAAVTLSHAVTDVTDNNTLRSTSAKWQQYWLQTARLQAWSGVSYYQYEGKNQSVPYFSPNQYNVADVKVGGSWVESRQAGQGRYRKHSLEWSQGFISQKSFPTRASGVLHYQLAWQWSPKLSAEMSFDRIRTAYDGVPEMHSAFKIAIRVIQ